MREACGDRWYIEGHRCLGLPSEMLRHSGGFTAMPKSNSLYEIASQILAGVSSNPPPGPSFPVAIKMSAFEAP
jgi:hypothetical protein